MKYKYNENYTHKHNLEGIKLGNNYLIYSNYSGVTITNKEEYNELLGKPFISLKTIRSKLIKEMYLGE